MDQQHTEALMSMIGLIDRRFRSRTAEDLTATATAWGQALPEWVTPYLAWAAVIDHYKTSTWTVTPAEVITGARRVAERENRERARDTGAHAFGESGERLLPYRQEPVPMPGYVRETLERVMGRKPSKTSRKI